MKAAIRRQRPHRIDRRALLAEEFGLRVSRIGRGWRRRRRHRLDGQRALVDQPIDHPGGNAGLPRRIRLAVQQPVRQAFDQPATRRCQPPRWLADQPYAQTGPLGPEIFAHPQRHAQHHAACRQRVVRDPVDQRPQFLFQRRHVELFADILQPVVQARIGIGVFPPTPPRPPHAAPAARTPRHPA